MKKINFTKSKKQLANNLKVKAILFMFVAFFTTILTTSVIGQSTLNLKEAIRTLKNSSSASDRVKGDDMYKLAYELNPTLNIEQGKILATSDETPICVDIDNSSLSILYTNNPKFEKIEYLSIKITDSQNVNLLDLSKLTSFKSLKYVHIECRQDFPVDFINNLVKNRNPNVQVFYSIVIPN